MHVETSLEYFFTKIWADNQPLNFSEQLSNRVDQYSHSAIFEHDLSVRKNPPF